MGISTSRVLFWSDQLAIVPHTATHALWVGERVPLHAFANGHTMRLDYVIDTGEYIATLSNGEFIQGPAI